MELLCRIVRGISVFFQIFKNPPGLGLRARLYCLILQWVLEGPVWEAAGG